MDIKQIKEKRKHFDGQIAVIEADWLIEEVERLGMRPAI